MNARDVEEAAASVDRTLRRTFRLLAAGGVVAGLGLVMILFSTGFAIALGVGAAFELALAVALWLYRRERIQRLALDPSAYSIPAVARFGARNAKLKERRRLASWIDSVVQETGSPLGFHLVVRVGRFAHQLEALARELAAPSAEMDPAMAVACRRLLTRPVESPLYNPNLPEEDLRAALLRIRAGITAAGGSAP